MVTTYKGKEGGGKRGSGDTGQVRRTYRLTGTQRGKEAGTTGGPRKADRKDKKAKPRTRGNR